MPVSQPISLRVHTTSSVDRFPEAPGAKGQPPRPPRAACTLVTPHIHGRQGVGHAQAAGIMEVDHQIQTGICVLHGADHCAHLGGIGNADSIAQAAGLHTGVHIVFQKIYRGGGIVVFPLKGTAKGGGQITMMSRSG